MDGNGKEKDEYVVCKKDSNYSETINGIIIYLKTELSYGRVYRIMRAKTYEILITNDNNENLWYDKSLFISVRGAKLNRILKNNFSK